MVEYILPFKTSSWTFVEQAALRFRAKARSGASPRSRKGSWQSHFPPWGPERARGPEAQAQERWSDPGSTGLTKTRGAPGERPPLPTPCSWGSQLWHSENCRGVNKCVQAFLPRENASWGERVQRESFWDQQLTSWGDTDPEHRLLCCPFLGELTLPQIPSEPAKDLRVPTGTSEWGEEELAHLREQRVQPPGGERGHPQ